jgi:hypothetical protein
MNLLLAAPKVAIPAADSQGTPARPPVQLEARRRKKRTNAPDKAASMFILLKIENGRARTHSMPCHANTGALLSFPLQAR